MTILKTLERLSPGRTRRTPSRAVALLLGTGVLATAHALDVHVIDARYSVAGHTRSVVSVPTGPGTHDEVTTVVDRSATSVSPTSAAIENRPSFHARADASMFRVFTSTDAVIDYAHGETYAFAQATAETFLTFRPLADAMAPMTFDFQGSGLGFYSSGSVELQDLTSSEMLYAYDWTCCNFRGSVPWMPAAGPVVWNQARLVPSTTLFASHEYEVIFRETTYANDDGQFVSIDLSGLTPVTEPRGAALLGVGLLAGLALVRRRIRIARGQLRTLNGRRVNPRETAASRRGPTRLGDAS